MKQNITVDQLNKLSEKSRDRLQEWWQPRLGDLYIQENSNEPEEVIAFTPLDPDWINAPAKYPELCMYPLLSIGQMIEFLDEYDQWCMEKIEKIDEDNPKRYRVQSCGDKYFDLELCDALWKAVKTILEQ